MGGSREEPRAPCLKSLAPGIAVKKNTLDVRACVSEKHGRCCCTSHVRTGEENQTQTGSEHAPRISPTHLPPNNSALHEDLLGPEQRVGTVTKLFKGELSNKEILELNKHLINTGLKTDRKNDAIGQVAVWPAGRMRRDQERCLDFL